MIYNSPSFKGTVFNDTDIKSSNEPVDTASINDQLKLYLLKTDTQDLACNKISLSGSNARITFSDGTQLNSVNQISSIATTISSASVDTTLTDRVTAIENKDIVTDTSLNALNTWKTSLISDLATMQSEIDGNANDISTLNTWKLSTDDAITNQSTAFSTLQTNFNNTITTYDNALYNIQQSVNSYDTTINDISTNVASYDSQLASINADLLTNYNSINTKQDIINTSNKLSISNVDLTTSSLNNYDSDIATINSNITTNTNNIALKQDIINGSNKLPISYVDLSGNALNNYETTISAMNTQINTNTTNVNNNTTLVNSLNTTVSTYDSQFTTVNNTLTNYDTSLNELLTDFTNLNVTVNNLDTSMNDFNTSYTSQFSTINTTLTNYNDSINTLNTVTTNLDTSMNDFNTSYTSQFSTINSTLTIHDSSLNDLQYQIDNLPTGGGSSYDDTQIRSDISANTLDIATNTSAIATKQDIIDINNKLDATFISGLPVQNILYNDVTYYISTTGSDSNDGSLSNPFATLQYAYDTATAFNFNSYTVKIKFLDGTYTNDQGLSAGKAFQNGTLIIEGNLSNRNAVTIDQSAYNKDWISFQNIFNTGILLVQYLNVIGNGVTSSGKSMIYSDLSQMNFQYGNLSISNWKTFIYLTGTSNTFSSVGDIWVGSGFYRYITLMNCASANMLHKITLTANCAIGQYFLQLKNNATMTVGGTFTITLSGYTITGTIGTITYNSSINTTSATIFKTLTAPEIAYSSAMNFFENITQINNSGSLIATQSDPTVCFTLAQVSLTSQGVYSVQYMVQSKFTSLIITKGAFCCVNNSQAMLVVDSQTSDSPFACSIYKSITNVEAEASDYVPDANEADSVYSKSFFYNKTTTTSETLYLMYQQPSTTNGNTSSNQAKGIIQAFLLR